MMNLAGTMQAEMGSATVPAAPVGVSPTGLRERTPDRTVLATDRSVFSVGGRKLRAGRPRSPQKPHRSGLVELPPLTTRLKNRQRVAAERAGAARAALAECRFCAHDCGVNRLAGEVGVCRADALAHVHLAQIEMADELELIPTFAIALSGCDLRCAFCITGAQSWNPHAGEALTPSALARQAEAALTDGARTVTFLGGEPTIHIPFLLEVVAALPDWAKLVLKTNAYCSTASRELLDGLFDVWCADYKFDNDACAQRLGRVPRYNETVRENMIWAAQQSDLIVRHLLMPGHVECCWRPVAEWLGTHLPGVKVSLRTGFWPGWQAARHAELRGTVSPADRKRAFEIAAKHDLNPVP
jgi:putative pyruvate formate lyase activating enzyme